MPSTQAQLIPVGDTSHHKSYTWSLQSLTPEPSFVMSKSTSIESHELDQIYFSPTAADDRLLTNVLGLIMTNGDQGNTIRHGSSLAFRPANSSVRFGLDFLNWSNQRTSCCHVFSVELPSRDKSKKKHRKCDRKKSSKSDFSKWKHYESFWQQEGEKAYNEYIKRQFSL